MGLFTKANMIISVCLAIYGIFNYLGVLAYRSLDRESQIEVSAEVIDRLVEEYLVELRPLILEASIERVSDRISRYVDYLIKEGVIEENEYQEGVTETREKDNEESPGN